MTSPTSTPSLGSNSESMLLLIEDAERLRKEKARIQRDHNDKKTQQDERINSLQTTLENILTDLAYQKKKTLES